MHRHCGASRKAIEMTDFAPPSEIAFLTVAAASEAAVRIAATIAALSALPSISAEIARASLEMQEMVHGLQQPLPRDFFDNLRIEVRRPREIFRPGNDGETHLRPPTQLIGFYDT